jgi:hypothetical protein
MEEAGSTETVITLHDTIFQKAIIFNYVSVHRIHDGVMSAKINNGSSVPTFCSECMEERFVLKLL